MPTGINLGDTATATSTAAAATCNHTGSIITTEALTTAAAADYTFVLTNACISPDSIVLVSVQNGTNTRDGAYAHGIVPAAGSVTFKVRNTHASALNGTLKLSVVAH